MPWPVSGRLFVILSLALLAWVLPAAHSMPIDADGPSGLSDNADFDDLIVSVTSSTAAAVPPVLTVGTACLDIIDAVVVPTPIRVHCRVPSSVENRAPPLD